MSRWLQVQKVEEQGEGNELLSSFLKRNHQFHHELEKRSPGPDVTLLSVLLLSEITEGKNYEKMMTMPSHPLILILFSFSSVQRKQVQR